VAANLARLQDDLCALQAAGCDELHFDVGDGVFVPGFGLGIEVIEAVKSCCSLPCCVHLLVQKPEDHIARFVQAGCSIITVHVEAAVHAHRLLNQIRDLGASPGIAINPATPLTKLDYLLDYVDRVLFMVSDGNHATRSLQRNAYERIKILKDNIAYRELAAKIEIGEDVSVQEAALFARAGAEVFDLGKRSLFKDANIGQNMASFRSDLAHQTRLA